MVTLPNPTPTQAATPPTPPKGMTIRAMADFCGCSANKVAVYIRTCGVAPSGTIKDKYHPSLNIYDFTNEDAEYLRETHRVSNARRIPDEERIASGWLTATEAAAKWGCGVSKATSLLLEAKAPYKWEGGSPYRGRKFYKIPRPPRDPQAYKAKQKDERGDWLAGVASKEVKDMVLDERKWRGMVGKRVAVELKKYDQRIEGVLRQYSMCWFIIKRDNGRVETYKHNEAKVVEEAK